MESRTKAYDGEFSVQYMIHIGGNAVRNRVSFCLYFDVFLLVINWLYIVSYMKTFSTGVLNHMTL